MASSLLPSSHQVVVLARRPVGEVQPGVDLVLKNVPTPQFDSLAEGEIIVKNLWLSLDPAMRGWMNNQKSYIPPVKLGAIMRGGTVGQVVASKSQKFKTGQLVQGLLGWAEYAKSNGKGLQPVILPPGVSPSTLLGALGITGLTAYFGLLEVGKIRHGDTVLVSAAAGATGSVVGQIAKHVYGCRVVGIAGGPTKCGWLTQELGFDAAVDYKASTNLAKDLKAACPKGVDIYFDNVGGAILNESLRLLRKNARVVLCGAISQYNKTTPPAGPSNYLSLLVNSARMEGFIVFNYAHRYGEATRALAGWLVEGKIKYKEDVAYGMENAPDALLRLFSGANKGKQIVKLAEPPLPVVAAQPRARL